MTPAAQPLRGQPAVPGAHMTDQAAFVSALLDPSQACPADLRSWNGSDPTSRFAVHRNNIVVSLVDTLADQFPVTLELVGAEFFRAMARAFVQQHPPRTRIMAFIGTRFAAFIASFAPAVSVPYLADVARLEMTRIEACHAADADTLASDEIGRVLADPHRLALATVVFHPSVHLLFSPHAIFSLWAAHQGALDIADVDPAIAQHVLVFRDGLDVQALQLTPGAHGLLTRLRSGDTLAEAAGAAVDADASFDLPGAIALLLRHPLVTRMEPLP